MVKFLPPWRDSQKSLISVWKNLGSFSLSSGNKIGVICSQDLSIGLGSCCSPCWVCSTCVPLQHLACAATSFSSSSKAEDLESDYVLLGFFSCHFKSTVRSWLAVLTPSLLPPILLWLYQQVVAPLLFCAPFIFGARLGSDRLCVVQSVLTAGKCKHINLFCPCASPSHAPALPHHLLPCSPSPANLLLRLEPICTQESQTGCTGLLALANSFCIVSALSNISPVFTSVFSTEAADPFSLFKDYCGLGWALQVSAQCRVIFGLI